MTNTFTDHAVDYQPKKNLYLHLSDNITYLEQEINALIQCSQQFLRGVYDLCSVCQYNSRKSYALISAEYYEDNIPKSVFNKIAKKDAMYLHNEMKKEKIPVDYLFVIAYFNHADPSKKSITIGIATDENI